MISMATGSIEKVQHCGAISSIWSNVGHIVYVEIFEWQNLRKFWKLCGVFENKILKQLNDNDRLAKALLHFENNVFEIADSWLFRKFSHLKIPTYTVYAGLSISDIQLCIVICSYSNNALNSAKHWTFDKP